MKDKTTPSKAIAYYFVGPTIAGDHPMSLAQQKSAVRRYAAMYGYRVIRGYVDVGGSKLDRPELEKASRDCRACGADLTIARFDRLPPNVCFFQELKKNLSEYRQGLRVAFCDVVETNQSDLVANILMAVAEARSVAADEYAARRNRPPA